MKYFSLKFLNPQLESQFQAEIKAERTNRYLSFALIELVFCLMLLIQSMIMSANKLFEVMKFFGIIFLVFLLLILKKYKSCILIYVLKIIFFSFVIFFCELIHMLLTENYRCSSNALSLAIPLQLILSMILLTKTGWMLCCFYYILALIYFFIRNIDLNGNTSPHYSYVISGLFFSFMSFSFMAYYQERMERGYYKQNYESTENLNFFKLLLQKIIPSPIFIVNYDENRLKFANRPAVDLLSEDSISPNLESPNKESKEKYQFLAFNHLLEKFSRLEAEKTADGLFVINNNKKEESLASVFLNYYKNPENEPLETIGTSFGNIAINFFVINVRNNEFFTTESEKLANSELMRNKIYYEIKIIKLIWQEKVCLLVIFDDNSQAFHISELINLDNYKNQLLASVSHDLRTPLHGMNGMLEIAIEQTDDKKLRSSLSLALKSGNLLNFLVNDILDFSQINFKKLRLNIQEANLLEIAMEIKSLLEFQAREKRVEILIENKHPFLRPINSDSNRIKQILLNLVSNSLKFTNKGHVKIIISQDLLYENCCKITVEDTGVGILPEDLPKLFRLFGKLESTQHINKTGIGLGLTISKMLSKMLCTQSCEGLQVESVFGEGCKFFFYVENLKNTMNLPEDFETIQERKEISMPEPITYEFFDENTRLQSSSLIFVEANNRKVLVVDDDLINILIVEQYLAYFNLKSVRAMNGLEAFEIVEKNVKEKNNEIALIIMDCNMPIWNGFEASENICELLKKENIKKIPILAVTANLTLADKEKCKECNIEFYMEKPMKRDDLRDMIEKILRIKIFAAA